MILLKPPYGFIFIMKYIVAGFEHMKTSFVCSKMAARKEGKGAENMEQVIDYHLSSRQQEQLDVRLALALIEQLYHEGRINQQTVQKIRKRVQKRLDNLKEE